MPKELKVVLGDLMILYGRLEHMVLLAIKRKREISLKEAEKLYKGYTLGSKLNGNRPCSKAGSACRNSDGQIGLRELVKGDSNLEDICNKIQDLTTRRNSFMHGLMTTVAETSVLIHNKKLYKVTESELWNLSEELMWVISRLNELIPVPGLTALVATGPDLDIEYESAALNPTDPIVKKANS